MTEHWTRSILTGLLYKTESDLRRDADDEEAYRAHIAYQDAMAAASLRTCPHGLTEDLVCDACDPPSSGRRPRCIHGGFADCVACLAGEPAPIVTALTDRDRAMWDHPTVRARVSSALGLVWRALSGEPGVRRRPQKALVALSGGKDSVAVLALVRKILPTVHVLWSDDELEYPAGPDFIARLERNWDLDLTVTLGFATHAGWFRPWTDRPFWREARPDALDIGRRVEEWQADETYDLVFTGLRAQESRRRRDHLLTEGPLYRAGGGWRCCPIWDWSADDVWALIAGWELPYHPAYDVLASIGVARDKQRIGPLPLARRADLVAGWPGLYDRLVARYGDHWA